MRMIRPAYEFDAQCVIVDFGIGEGCGEVRGRSGFMISMKC